MAQRPTRRRGSGDARTGRVRLAGVRGDDAQPKVSVWALGREGEVLGRAEVGENGKFSLPADALEKAAKVAIGPAREDDDGAPDKSVKRMKAAKFAKTLEAGDAVRLPRRRWLRWLTVRRCVSGTVRKCWFLPFPPIRLAAALTPSPVLPRRTIDLGPLAGPSRPEAALPPRAITAPAVISDAVTAFPILPPFRRHCDPVCDGIVEVWRRICCRKPFVVLDPRIPDLIEWLEDLIPRPPDDIPPPPPWPPRPWPWPEPDPVPWEGGPDLPPDPVRMTPISASAPVLRSGALDERALNARADLDAIRSLPPAEVAAYINARPYLLWRWECSDPVRVAVGTIDEGEFDICWREPPRLLLHTCEERYAYVVRQHIDGQTITIYDGVSAGHWHDYDDEPELTSYHPRAHGCRHNDPPVDEAGAFALLQDIGLAGSYVLHTPPADSWDSVAAPLAYNHGLAFPEPNPALAKGRWKNRNWGGLLRLRYHFSEAMRALGAKYYRVSVAAANAAGNPTGPRAWIAAPQWRWYEVVGTDIFVRRTALGPHTVGGATDLYEIPYDADRDWQSGQYHALLDTTAFANGRHLLTLEVFDAAGQLLRPTGTPDPGGSAQAAYTYRRWQTETGPTLEVPFAALTHLLWWDNRRAVGQIVDLRKDGAPNTAECQFLEGSAKSRFSVGYRAYHPEPMFLYDHRVWWRRGLGGPSGVLTSPHPNPDNVGVPPGAPHQSGEEFFGPVGVDLGMLGPHQKCSFSVNLHVNVKTYNGVGTLDALDDWDQAAFALDISGA